ncbi:Syntaxin-61-like protein [Drosera capensis]
MTVCLTSVIDMLQSSFQEWERVTSTSGEQTRLRKELLTGCESIEWQVDELEKAIAVASRDPSRYRTDEVELQSRRGWTKKAREQVGTIKEALSTGKAPNSRDYGNMRGMHTELVRHSGDSTRQVDRSYQHAQDDDDDFIVSESDRQLLLIKQQDEELDELSATVQRIGNVGLTIHDELLAQEKIIDELGMDMDSTTNRLDFLQIPRKKGQQCHEESRGERPNSNDAGPAGLAYHPVHASVLDLKSMHVEPDPKNAMEWCFK